MTDKIIHVAGHTKIVGGKAVWVPMHDRHIQHDVDADFDNLLGEIHGAKGGEPKQEAPKAVEAPAAVAEDSILAGIDKAPVPFAVLNYEDVQPGMVFALKSDVDDPHTTWTILEKKDGQVAYSTSGSGKDGAVTKVSGELWGPYFGPAVCIGMAQGFEVPAPAVKPDPKPTESAQNTNHLLPAFTGSLNPKAEDFIFQGTLEKKDGSGKKVLMGITKEPNGGWVVVKQTLSPKAGKWLVESFGPAGDLNDAYAYLAHKAAILAAMGYPDTFSKKYDKDSAKDAAKDYPWATIENGGNDVLVGSEQAAPQPQAEPETTKVGPDSTKPIAIASAGGPPVFYEAVEVCHNTGTKDSVLVKAPPLGPLAHALQAAGAKWSPSKKAWTAKVKTAGACLELHEALSSHAGGAIPVGTMKVVDGKTYVLNENHRWQLKDAEALASHAANTVQSANPGDAFVLPGGIMARRLAVPAHATFPIGIAPVGSHGKLPPAVVAAIKAKCGGGKWGVYYATESILADIVKLAVEHGGDGAPGDVSVLGKFGEVSEAFKIDMKTLQPGDVLWSKKSGAVYTVTDNQAGGSVFLTKQGGKKLHIPAVGFDEWEKNLVKSGNKAAIPGTNKPTKVAATPKAYQPGEGVPFADLKVGMSFGLKTATGAVNTYQVEEIGDGVVKMTLNGQTQLTADKQHWASAFEKDLTLLDEKGDLIPVGTTKVINGKTYILNANHRWELQSEAAKPKPAPLPKGFPFKQVGGKLGTNEGGIYEDAFGKKWYIKFPKTEDHAKNELLASKLYAMAGVSAPKSKLVVKDGKVGIASKWEDGLAKASPDVLASNPDVMTGFAVDAWLGNWDVVGLEYDNLLIDQAGRPLRVDPGGALLFRAQGGPKGEAFGDVVTELDTLKNAGMNPQAAAVFGKATDEQIQAGVVAVLEIPDDVINQAVAKFGPGTEAEKAALAAKLIARKKDLAAKYPEADLIANPPKPDPLNLKVDMSKLPPKPDFYKWPDTGKPLSSIPAVNDANTKAVNEIYEMALKGNLPNLKAMTFDSVDKTTGAVTKVTGDQHLSKHVRGMHAEVVAYMDVLAAGTAKIKTFAQICADVADSSELSEAFPSEPWGMNPGNCDPHKSLGYFMVLGAIEDVEGVIPGALPHHSTWTSQVVKKGQSDYSAWPSVLKDYISHVQSTGGINHAFKGDQETYSGVDLKKALIQAYDHAVEMPEGAVINRWMNCPIDMYNKLKTIKPGTVFQNTDSMCCSKAYGWDQTPHFDGSSETGLLLTIRYAKGAKAVHTFGSGKYGKEEEVTTLPGQRFVIINKGTAVGGKLKLELLMLPPDDSFVDSVSNATKGKGAA